MQVSIIFTFLAFAALFQVGNCEEKSSADRQMKTRQVHADGSELFANPGSQVAGGGKVDEKSLHEIQKDLARLTTAGSNLKTLIGQMSGILNNNPKSSAQYNLAGGYYPVDNFVKFYKTTYGYNGYPHIAGIPCAGIPTVTTVPTIPVLIKRITADTTYLMDLYNRGLVTTSTSVSSSHVANTGFNTGVVLTHH